MNHTWHPNTFGLLYGKTTKTACARRVATGTLVRPLAATCTECQDAIIEELCQQQEMHMHLRDLLKEASDDWQSRHPAVDGDNRSPLDALDAGLISPREFWQIVYSDAQ